MDSGAQAFVQAVEARVTELRGSGYALSGVEAHVVLGWWEAGHALADVLAAAEHAATVARRRGKAGFGLGAVTRRLESLVARRVGAGGEAVGPGSGKASDGRWARLMGLVRAAGEGLPEGAAREALRGVWRRLGQAEAAGRDLWEVASEADAALLEALSPLTPAGVTAEALAALEATEAWRQSSPRARADAEALAQAAAVRSYFGLPELLEALLHP